MNFNELDLSVLKGILHSKKNAFEFSSECPDTVFSNELYRFAKAVSNYIKVYKEVPTPKTLTETQGGGNESLVKYFVDVYVALETVEVNEREFKFNLKTLKDRHATNLLSSLNEALFSEGNLKNNIDQNVNILQQTVARVKGLYKNKIFDQKTLKESITAFKSMMEAKRLDPNFGRGILTGYDFLDYQTNGLRPAELFLVAGESGSGKSTLLMNLAIQMWMQKNKINTPKPEYKKGYNVLFFSLEMPYEQCLNRVVSRLSEAPYRGIRDGSLSGDNLNKIGEALTFIRRYPCEFEIVDIPRGATVANLELIYNETKLRFDPDIVVVDYLGLMEYEGPEADDWLKLGHISAQLHEFARVYNCCVLSAVQLNRMAKTKDASPDEKIGAHRIGRSAMIIQNANIALQIEKRAEEHMHTDMLCHLIKNRDGENVKGRLLKHFGHCALLNDFGLDESEASNTDDISDKVKAII